MIIFLLFKLIDKIFTSDIPLDDNKTDKQNQHRSQWLLLILLVYISSEESFGELCLPAQTTLTIWTSQKI
jgi:hypothetical protein